MDVHVLNSAASNIEMSSLQEVCSASDARDNAEVQVAAKNINRRNLKKVKEVEKKKPVSVKRKRSKNVNDRKTENNDRPNSSLSKKGRKKKVESKENSESDMEHETVDVETFNDGTAKSSKENKSDSMNSHKSKTTRKVTEEKIVNDAFSTIDQNRHLIGQSPKTNALMKETSKNGAKKEKEKKISSLKRNAKESEENRSDRLAKEIVKSTNGGIRKDGKDSGDKIGKIIKEKKNEGLKRTTVHPPISEMVLDSFRALRKRNGTPTEEIVKYIEENYQVNINRIKPHIKKFLQKSVSDGLFDLVSNGKGDGKFKIKKMERVNKGIAKVNKTTGKFKKGTTYMKKVTRKSNKDKKIEKKVKKESTKGKTRVRKITGKVRNTKTDRHTKRRL